jgi:hypothetical protein
MIELIVVVFSAIIVIGVLIWHIVAVCRLKYELRQKPFWIVLADNHFKKGDHISMGLGREYKVIRVYKYTWFKKQWNRFGLFGYMFPVPKQEVRYKVRHLDTKDYGT